MYLKEGLCTCKWAYVCSRGPTYLKEDLCSMYLKEGLHIMFKRAYLLEIGPTYVQRGPKSMYLKEGLFCNFRACLLQRGRMYVQEGLLLLTSKRAYVCSRGPMQ